MLCYMLFSISIVNDNFGCIHSRNPVFSIFMNFIYGVITETQSNENHFLNGPPQFPFSLVIFLTLINYE